jgi:RNA polymerase primary sigma factor
VTHGTRGKKERSTKSEARGARSAPSRPEKGRAKERTDRREASARGPVKAAQRPGRPAAAKSGTPKSGRPAAPAKAPARAAAASPAGRAATPHAAARPAARTVDGRVPARVAEPRAGAANRPVGRAGGPVSPQARPAAAAGAGAARKSAGKAGGTGRAARPRGRVSLELNKAKKSHFDEGSLDQYLKEISQYPLITREEEVELAKRIKKGDQAALEKLCRSNLRFVVSVAKKYQNQGVSLADLINEGNLGLIRAAHKFDETKGIKFISYAVWWIRQAILQALAEQSRIVRVPLNRAGTLHRIGKKSNSLLQELGREPTVEEIADGMDISLEEVRKTMSISQSHLSLDAPLTPGEDNKLLDYLPDEYNPSPDDNAFERALGEAIQDSLDTLKPREAKILKLYYGLDNQEAMTLEEIGSVLGITRERVRQIKEKALSRLRHVSRARALQSFLT